VERFSFRSMKWLLDFLKGKWLRHPLHPILVHVPMAIWPSALIFDLLDVRTGKVTNGPAKVDLKTFKIEKRDGKVCIAMPRATEKSS
jgi:hypothetical protein